MKKIIFMLLPFLIIGCKSVDRTNVNEVSKDLLDLVIGNDTLSIKSFLSDSTEIVNFDYVPGFKDYVNLYKNKDYTIIRIDTIPSDDFNYVDVFYKIDSSYHRLEYNYTRNSNNQIEVLFIFLNNLNKDCLEYLSKPFKPEIIGLYSEHLSWSNPGKRLDNVRIQIRNHYDEDFDFLKFKLEIFRENDLIVDRTFVINEKIFAGDVMQYHISELDGTYIGEKLTTDNIRYNFVPLEVSHPEHELCQELDMIMKYKSN